MPTQDEKIMDDIRSGRGLSPLPLGSRVQDRILERIKNGGGLLPLLYKTKPHRGTIPVDPNSPAPTYEIMSRSFQLINPQLTCDKIRYLCWYAKAMYLASHDLNLFSERFQATIYNVTIHVANCDCYESQIKSALEWARIIYASYWNYSEDELRNSIIKSHPYKESNWPDNYLISDTSIQKYYRKFLRRRYL